ncbi:MAG: D-alanine--D-alanine ligase family protein [Patescibacteria group bacterium]
MAKKIRVGVIFGGRSAEHEVSLVSAASVISALDQKIYEVIPIGITKQGQWLVGEPLKALKSGNLKQVNPVTPPTNVLQKGLVRAEKKARTLAIDVFFPVLHGPYGEDGTIQGLLELTDIPYVGAGVLASALGMDKVAQKQLYEQAGIPTPKFIFFHQSDWRKDRNKIIKRIKKEIGFPCFIKPPNLGSSVGISKVRQEKDLIKAIKMAFRYDLKVIVEKSVEEAREIEISVLGNDQPRVSLPGEIVPSNEFYDYEAKYIDNRSKAVIPAKLPKTVIKKIQAYALAAFKLLNISGMARADFLVEKKGFKIYLNEINTIPGFTSISMYPKLWQASGLDYADLISELIRLARERNRQKKALQTSYRPKKNWYK